MPSISPITAGQQTRSTSRLTDQSTRTQEEQTGIISDKLGEIYFLFSTLHSIQWKDLDCHSCLFIPRALCHGCCAYRGLWAHGIVWHVARKAFFQPDRRSERDAGPAPEVNHLIRCYFTLKLACTLRITL